MTDLKKAALAFVNARRKEAGLRATSRLSKGYKGDKCGCPIANSLEKVGVKSADFAGDHVILSGGGAGCVILADLPTVEFMRRFDMGEFPELEKPPTVIKVKGKVIP